MDINKSLNILNLSKDYTYSDLKKAYHINALLYHPDKNTNDTSDKFKDINEAFNILNSNLNTSKKSNNNNNRKCDKNYEFDKDYLDLVFNFIIFLSKDNNDDILDKINYQSEEIIKRILNNLSLSIIEDIYLYIENNDSIILNYIDISTKLLLIKIIKQYINDYSIIVIKPNISNLINKDVYKLKINDELIYIPLWHNKLIYKKNIIDIQPELPNHIKINNNILYYTLKKKYYDIIESIKQDNHYLYLSDIDKYVDISCLQFKNYQTVILKNKGLPKIDYNNNFSLLNYNDIIITLLLD